LVYVQVELYITHYSRSTKYSSKWGLSIADKGDSADVDVRTLKNSSFFDNFGVSAWTRYRKMGEAIRTFCRRGEGSTF